MECLGLFIHLAYLRSPLPYDYLELHRLFYSTDAWLAWFKGLAAEDNCWIIPQWIFYSVTVRLPGHSGVCILGLFTTTLYLPSMVVKQFELLQDTLNGDSIGFLRDSMLRPSTIFAFMTAWH